MPQPKATHVKYDNFGGWDGLVTCAPHRTNNGLLLNESSIGCLVSTSERADKFEEVVGARLER